VTQIDWHRLLSTDDACELCPAAAAGDVTAAEAGLAAVFPADLRQLYLVSNGVFDRSGQWFVIWPLPEVVTRNSQAWTQDVSLARRELTGFGDDGTGAPFCVPRDGSSSVFAWSPIEGKATLLAKSVADFWSGWIAGMLPPH
jgi:cell wall assembly regulator SMI1